MFDDDDYEEEFYYRDSDCPYCNLCEEMYGKSSDDFAKCLGHRLCYSPYDQLKDLVESDEDIRRMIEEEDE